MAPRTLFVKRRPSVALFAHDLPQPSALTRIDTVSWRIRTKRLAHSSVPGVTSRLSMPLTSAIGSMRPLLRSTHGILLLKKRRASAQIGPTRHRRCGTPRRAAMTLAAAAQARNTSAAAAKARERHAARWATRCRAADPGDRATSVVWPGAVRAFHCGQPPSERHHSKAGTARPHMALIEAAWTYRNPAAPGKRSNATRTQPRSSSTTAIIPPARPIRADLPW